MVCRIVTPRRKQGQRQKMKLRSPVLLVLRVCLRTLAPLRFVLSQRKGCNLQPKQESHFPSERRRCSFCFAPCAQTSWCWMHRQRVGPSLRVARARTSMKCSSQLLRPESQRCLNRWRTLLAIPQRVFPRLTVCSCLWLQLK